MIVKLSNGKRVANFGTFAPLTFSDGNILPAVTEEMAKQLAVTMHHCDLGKGDMKFDVGLSYDTWDAIAEWVKKWKNNEVDVVFITTSMLQALYKFEYDVRNSPFRVPHFESEIARIVSIKYQYF